MTRRLGLVLLVVGVSACANDYDQFTFGTGPQKDASMMENPRPDVAVPPDRADSSMPDVGTVVDADASGSDDALRDALPDDHRDAETDAGVDVVEAGPPEDAPEEADAGTVEDAGPDVEDAGGPDVPSGDDGGDADASVEDASVEPDAPEDVSVDDGAPGEDGPADTSVGCDGEQKSCGDHCVGLGDPATGCAGPSCNPCNLAHATSRCGLEGGCIIDMCEPGFDDCDHTPENGCETAIHTDVAHCGACGRACSDAHVASKECSAGVCVSTCDLGFGNCERPSTGPDDGCERAVDADGANCGSCGNDCHAAAPGLTCGGVVPNLCGCADNASCRVGGSNGSCESSGVCKCGPTQCRPGETCRLAQGPDVCSCNDGPACADTDTCCQLPAGCRNLAADPSSCGACGHACPAGFVCLAGACGCDADVECGSNGTCAAGQCVCNGTTCPPGKRCLAGGGCG